MNEQILRLGTHGGLVGVLSVSSLRQSDTAVVFLNAGMLPRSGPYRLHVEAGRRMTSLGFDHLRLDQANLGDSRERAQPDSAEERAFLDIADTLNTLSSEFAYKRFVLVGLCAGAYCALLYAPKDSRVKGVVLLDPPTQASFQYHLRNFLNVFSLRRWRNIVLRRLKRLKNQNVYNPHAANPPSKQLSRAESENALFAGLKENRQYLFVSSGDSPFPHNSPNQLAELYPRVLAQHKNQIEQIWLPRATHLYSFREDRVEMMEKVETWLQKYF